MAKAIVANVVVSLSSEARLPVCLPAYLPGQVRALRGELEAERDSKLRLRERFERQEAELHAETESKVEWRERAEEFAADSEKLQAQLLHDPLAPSAPLTLSMEGKQLDDAPRSCLGRRETRLQKRRRVSPCAIAFCG